MISGVLQALERHARLRPAAIAVHSFDAAGEEQELCWQALFDGVRALARRLTDCDKQVLLIVLPNGPEFLIAALAGLWAGAWVLPVSPDLPLEALAQLARGSAARGAIAPGALLERLAGLELRVASESLRPGAAAAAAPGADSVPSGEGALLLRTSATTGEPRIARRGVAALDAAGEYCRRRFELAASDRVLIAIPVFHSYGIEQALFTPVLAGCTVELHRGFDAHRVHHALALRPVTILPAVPVIVDALARVGAGARPAVLRRVYSAGSPLPRRVADAFESRFGTRVGQIYGATEFGGVTFNDPEDPQFDPECAGRPMHGVELRIVTDDGTEPAAPGVEGQIAVAAPSQLAEYLGDAEPAAPGGFVRSGDLGRIDASGRLFVTGRLKLLIDVGGLKVNPAEVEAVLMRHPKVREAVVLPLPFTDTASRLRAVVIPDPGGAPSREELHAFARTLLLPYQIPRTFEFRSDVPRSSTGKILRSALAAEVRA